MKYTVNDIKGAVKKSCNKKEVLELIGLTPIGGNYSTINKIIYDYDIDTSHFKSERLDCLIPIEMYLVDGLKTNSHRLKNKLIDDKLKRGCCEKCELNEWLGEKIPLELHHIDGNKYNNELNNLQILCPNCHSFTPNYRRKKDGDNFKYKTIKEMYPKFFIKIEDENYCDCGIKIRPHSTNCKNCSYINKRKVERPPLNILLGEIRELGYAGTGRKYGVSDNAIRRWVKSPLTK